MSGCRSRVEGIAAHPPLGESPGEIAGLWGAGLAGTGSGSGLSAAPGGACKGWRGQAQGRGKVKAWGLHGHLFWGRAGDDPPSRGPRNHPQSRLCLLTLQPALLRTPALRGAASYAQVLQSLPETQVSLLDNGLRVASEQTSQPTCTVSLGRHLRLGPRGVSVCDLGLVLGAFCWTDFSLFEP